MDRGKLRAEVHWDRVIACYPERATDLANQIAKIAADRPDAVAVVEGEERLRYADLYVQAGSLAAVLAAGGVGAGDRVAVMLANGVDAVRAVVAILRLGAVLVAVGTRSRAAELDYICADCAPSAVIYGPEFADVIAAASSTPAARFDVSASAWRTAITRCDSPPPPCVEEAAAMTSANSGP